jgi:hypothetical protein
MKNRNKNKGSSIQVSGLEAKVSQWLGKWTSFQQMGWDICYSLVTLVHEFGKEKLYPLLLSKSEDLTPARLDEIYQCGCRRFPIIFLFDNSHGGQLLREFKYEVAEKVSGKTDKITIVTDKGNSVYNTEYKHYSNLTKRECQLLRRAAKLSGTQDLPSVEQQIACLDGDKARKATPPETAPRDPYIIVKKPEGFRAVLRRSVSLGIDDVPILAERIIKALHQAINGPGGATPAAL